MNKIEAENFVYKSYLKAEKYQDYKAKDETKRRPDLTRDLIRKKSINPCVVVTGSKGKGSVANMISLIMQTKKKVGLMTSPHISDFCERFKINDKNISDEDFIKYMTMISLEIEQIDASIPKDICISPVGIETDLALTYFNDHHTDFNIFECGKGAKYDDVNNTIHQYAIINNIFLEHTRELGKTIEEIAQDKAHVINGEQKCALLADEKMEVREIVKRRAEAYKVPLKIYGEDFKAENIKYTNRGMLFDVVVGEKRYDDIVIPLLGEHQARNCALALATAKEILGEIDINEVRYNLTKLNWPGRMEVICEQPFMMLDACINSKSAEYVKDVLRHLNINKASIIVGIPDDKDYVGVVEVLSPLTNRVILTKSQNPHYLFSEKQRSFLASKGIDSIWINSIEEALALARKTNLPIVILGTTSLISEVKKMFLR